MTVTQEGTFRHGTYGFPVEITLSDDLATIAALAALLPSATAVNLEVARPDGSLITANLGLGSIISVPNCVVRWTPISGDLTLHGHYQLVLTIAFGPSMTLTVDGTMKVT